MFSNMRNPPGLDVLQTRAQRRDFYGFFTTMDFWRVIHNRLYNTQSRHSLAFKLQQQFSVSVRYLAIQDMAPQIIQFFVNKEFKSDTIN